MDSGSEPVQSAEEPPHKLASILGTLIALITLALPLLFIAHYSSSSSKVIQPNLYTLSGWRD